MVYCYFIIINILALIVMKWDKRQAIKHKQRVPEQDLFLLALVGGVGGIYLGMYLFRHKTKKMKFVLGIPIILIMWLLICVRCLIFTK